jgi:hypothetical protein
LFLRHRRLLGLLPLLEHELLVLEHQLLLLVLLQHLLLQLHVMLLLLLLLQQKLLLLLLQLLLLLLLLLLHPCQCALLRGRASAGLVGAGLALCAAHLLCLLRHQRLAQREPLLQQV